MDMGNDEADDTDSLPVTMVSMKRTGGEGIRNTTCKAGYAWHFTCDLQARTQEEWQVFIFFLNRFLLELVNQNEGCIACTQTICGNLDLYRHPVYT